MQHTDKINKANFFKIKANYLSKKLNYQIAVGFIQDLDTYILNIPYPEDKENRRKYADLLMYLHLDYEKEYGTHAEEFIITQEKDYFNTFNSIGIDELSTTSQINTPNKLLIGKIESFKNIIQHTTDDFKDEFIGYVHLHNLYNDIQATQEKLFNIYRPLDSNIHDALVSFFNMNGLIYDVESTRFTYKNHNQTSFVLNSLIKNPTIIDIAKVGFSLVKG